MSSTLLQPVPMQQQHGPIIHYRITYRLANAADALGTLTVNGSEQSLTIRGLSPWTSYSLTLEAENPKGLSPRSDIVSVRTAPAGVLNLKDICGIVLDAYPTEAVVCLLACTCRHWASLPPSVCNLSLCNPPLLLLSSSQQMEQTSLLCEHCEGL